MPDDEIRDQLAGIRAVLAETAEIHRQHVVDSAEIHRQHAVQLREIDALLAEVGEIQRRQAKELLTHAKLLAEHDERMERIGRHLEVLIDIVERKPE